MLGIILVITGDLSSLADTTVMLLLVAFTAVNISCLVLRREEVDHEHFRAPTIAPILAAIISVVLIIDNEAEVFIRAGILLAIGVVLWLVSYASGHRTGEHAPSSADSNDGERQRRPAFHPAPSLHGATRR